MIDETKTFILFRYTSEDLSYGSNKKVLAICNECGKERLITYRKYRDLCHACKHHTKETRRKISKNHTDVSGKNNPNFGGKKLIKTIKNVKPKISRVCRGDKHPMWKGGKKLRLARRSAKRRELFGFIPHNKPQANFHGHHLDFNHVIFIPAELHKSVYHSVTKNINMNIINDIVCDWYLKYQII